MTVRDIPYLPPEEEIPEAGDLETEKIVKENMVEETEAEKAQEEDPEKKQEAELEEDPEEDLGED